MMLLYIGLFQLLFCDFLDACQVGMNHNIDKIVSGGQTGVDRAALDVGLFLHIPIGGACPLGRIAEDGIIDVKYPLYETETSEYSARTFLNVQNSDATLILYWGELMGGTALTIEFAKTLNKPYLVINLDKKLPKESIIKWLEKNSVHILNIAGPRESTHPGIYEQAYDYLIHLFNIEV